MGGEGRNSQRQSACNTQHTHARNTAKNLALLPPLLLLLLLPLLFLLPPKLLDVLDVPIVSEAVPALAPTELGYEPSRDEPEATVGAKVREVLGQAHKRHVGSPAPRSPDHPAPAVQRGSGLPSSPVRSCRLLLDHHGLRGRGSPALARGDGILYARLLPRALRVLRRPHVAYFGCF